jgi:hypothetical protein
MAALNLDEFLQPLAIDTQTVLELSRELESTFRTLSAESLDQFLPTPISESILRPAQQEQGRQVEPLLSVPSHSYSSSIDSLCSFLAIDM